VARNLAISYRKSRELSMMQEMPLVLKIALIVVVVSAGVYDLRTRKIPNWLNLSGLVLGLGLNTILLHGHGIVLALLGLGLSLLIYLPLYLVRGMGAGDVKLMAAVGSIAGPQNWLVIFVVTALLGGLMALVLVFFKKRVYETVSNLSTILGEISHGKAPFHKDTALDMRSPRSLGLPHGAVIALGSLAFLLTI
jgi:prepilin peptidase CpaA